MSDFENELSKSVGPWVVQWCCTGEQKGTFHIDTLGCAIRSNLGVYAGIHAARYVSPWIILGVVPTASEASRLADMLRTRYCGEHDPNSKPDDERIFIPATENLEEVLRLKSMPYRAYLSSSHWQRIRERVLTRAKFRCQVCYGSGILDVHHRTYENRGEEHFADVIVLCRSCHELFHSAGKLTKEN
jgi:5-methylcytosine-specific restriction endonuclease McrA